MAFPFGAVGAGIGAGLGGRSAHKARRDMEHQRKIESGKLGHQFKQSKGLYADQLAALQELFDLYGNLYGQAQGAVSQLGAGAYRRIGEAEQQALSGTNAGLAQRGLYNSTIGANVGRGIRTDAERSRGEVDEYLGALRSNLFAGQAAGQGQALLGRVGAAGNMMDTRRNYALDRIGLWLGGGQTVDTGIYQQLGAAGAYLDDYLSNRGTQAPLSGQQGYGRRPQGQSRAR